MAARKNWRTRALVAGLAVCLAGCEEGPFDASKARATLNGSRLHLDGEQVLLTMQQVRCGEADRLWTITPMGGSRSVARLTEEGQKLGLSGDIQIGDGKYTDPYTQVRGDFLVDAVSVGDPKDDGPDGKLVDASLTLLIDHACLQKGPPRLMGVSNGEYSESAKPMIRFKRENEQWVVDRVVH